MKGDFSMPSVTALMLEVAITSETLANFYQTTDQKIADFIFTTVATSNLTLLVV